MSMTKSFLGMLFNDVVSSVARLIVESDEVCTCGHKRSDHCGCGAVCLAPGGDPGHNHDLEPKRRVTCGCAGFTKTAEKTKERIDEMIDEEKKRAEGDLP